MGCACDSSSSGSGFGGGLETTMDVEDPSSAWIKVSGDHALMAQVRSEIKKRDPQTEIYTSVYVDRNSVIHSSCPSSGLAPGNGAFALRILRRMPGQF